MSRILIILVLAFGFVSGKEKAMCEALKQEISLQKHMKNGKKERDIIISIRANSLMDAFIRNCKYNIEILKAREVFNSQEKIAETVLRNSLK